MSREDFSIVSNENQRSNQLDVANKMDLEFNENKADRTSLSYEDHKFLNIMKEGIHMKDEHYEIPLPFKLDRPLLPNNRTLALHRLKHLRKKLESNKKYFSDWQRAKRAIARCLKLKESLLKQVKGDDTPSMVIKVDDL